MRFKSILYLPFILLSINAVFANEPVFKQKYIIDTDCATDDFRAINLLLSRPEIEISAFIASDGTLETTEGASRLKGLLKEWNKDSIPVLCNYSKADVNPKWKAFNQHIKWAETQTVDSCEDFSPYIEKTLDAAEEKEYTFICLGSLSSVAELMDKYPLFTAKVRNIVWYNSSVFPREGFNYDCNPFAADKVLDAEKIRVDIISNTSQHELIFDQELFHLAQESGTHLARTLTSFHRQPEVNALLNDNHFIFMDELVAAYIFCPGLFNMTIKLPYISIRYNTSYNTQAIKEMERDLITGNYTSERNIVFNAFPSRRELYNYDVRLMMDSAIAKHGHEEWKACVITDEFHGHLGIFSIVGAKMGILAREYFNVEHDHLSVKSYAGITPPYSCMNDGIQVSTGATLGQGTISVSSDSISRPEAIFTHDDISIKIRLKDEYLKIINKDINEGIVKFGLEDEGYWKLVRQAALRYWLEWDRNEIFEINTVTNWNIN
ncbi:MAG: nucleoside hydrolase [Bacteroidales bacterium]|nr:nucleoside hydrolase [Bacteroidales bacterium]